MRAAAHPVTVIAAPAGYGKSVALEQYLATVETPYRMFDFAHDRFDFDVDGFSGTVSIDSLENVPGDTVEAIVSAIERTRGRTHWILVTRSVEGLPLGTWLARHVCELPIGSGDLLFTLDEVADATNSAGIDLDADGVRELASFTEGWPVALSIALRALKLTAERREAWTVVREAVTSYLDEQVYPRFDAAQRELLAVAAALPQVEADIVELAGFQDALQALDAIRRRTGLLQETDGQAFSLLQLVREYLRRRTALAGADWRISINGRAACALESAGRMEGALVAYCSARSQPDVLRILECGGFELLERGRVACVSQAVNALDDATRGTNPRILALRGVLQSLAGKPIRAEALLRRSLAHAKGDRDLVGFAGLRVAPLIANYGGDAGAILNPIVDDALQRNATKVEALSLLSVAYSIAGEMDAAERSIGRVTQLLDEIDDDAARARVLQRIGVAAMYIGENERAKQALIHAADLASELDLYSVASRAWSALANLMCHVYDDVMAQLWYAELAADAAMKSGDSLELQTALLQVAAAEMRRGNAEESAALEEQLTALRSDPVRAHLLVAFKALRFAWNREFSSAHQLLSSCWDRMHYDFDRLICGAQCALFLALDGRRDPSIRLIARIGELADTVQPRGLFRQRYVALALLLCVVAEMVNNRETAARKVAKRLIVKRKDDVIFLASCIANRFVHRDAGLDSPEILVAYERLSVLGYADVARLLEACSASLDASGASSADVPLTPSEIWVLQMLGEGLSTKEIAERNGRSVYTIRAHIANAMGKLKCRGRSHALAVARRLEIIP